MKPPPLTLVLGGARSGKSAHAESLIEATAPAVAVYLATGQAFDAEMAERIARHQARRGGRWRTVEEPLDLVGALRRQAATDRAVLVDCLTLWLSNLMLAERNMDAECDGLLAELPRSAGSLVLVSNEVGLGVVPDNALARAFRDHAGMLNQRIAAVADRVIFVAAGLPMVLKDRQR